jgi:hypothetical protein
MTDSTYNSSGISLIRLSDILANSITDSEASWDESIDTTINDAEDAFLGHLLRNMSLVVSDINEILQDIYDSGSVSNATGTRLDHLLALIGISRPSDAASTATVTLTASKATTVPAGSKYKTAANVIFQTDTALVFTAAGSSDVAVTCTTYGPNAAAIGDINTIVTDVDGITAVTNAAAATPGRYRATDAEQKASHTIAVATSGEGDAASIYEALIAVTGVSGVSVIENDTSETVDSIPAYSTHCIVIGGTAADIAAAIHNTKVGATPTYGGSSQNHYDTTTKQLKTINYSTGSEIPIYITVTVSLQEGQYDADYQVQIRDNLIAHFADFRIGDDVDFNALYGPLYQVSGITITDLKIDTTSPPANTTDEVMASTELATFTLANAATHLVITVV